jgi:uncharacterized membrane protein YedE/YeeE
MFALENWEIYELVNLLALFIGLSFGIVAQKNQFCFSGSIKDYVLTTSTKRAASVVLSMIIAISSSYIVSNNFEIDLTQSMYYTATINYFSLIFGASLFGMGMMIADGCSSRHLVKFAQGDIKSLVVLIFIAIFTYATTRGILSGPMNDFIQNETLLKISSMIENKVLNIYAVLGILSIVLLILIKKVSRIIYLKDGFLIGILVSVAWYVTGIIGEDSLEREIALEGLSFVSPIAKTLEVFTTYQVTDLSFGVFLVLGVLLGGFIMSKFNRKYSFGCTSNLKSSNIQNNMLGGALMGVGGVLAIGCTIGQGLTGLSTLAFSSFIAIITIFTSGYLTALFLNKRDALPMCFIFEWEEEKSK